MVVTVSFICTVIYFSNQSLVNVLFVHLICFEVTSMQLTSIWVSLNIIISGALGRTGASGWTGPSGQDGRHGGTGAIGPVGWTGATGVRGRSGATGVQGVSGRDGSTGQTGRTGPKGGTGGTGATGLGGPRGFTGSTGQEGPIGETGATGGEGNTGWFNTATFYWNKYLATILLLMICPGYRIPQNLRCFHLSLLTQAQFIYVCAYIMALYV